MMPRDLSTSRNPELKIAWGILIAGTLLRVLAGIFLSLSNDELSAMTRTLYGSFGELIQKGVYTDFHPAGVQVFLYYWTRLFGNSAFVFRLPFIVAGSASVWMIWLIGKQWFDKRTALFASAAFAFLQFPVLYSVFARPYSPGVFLGLCMAWFWTELVINRNFTIRNLAGFTITMALLLHIHYFSFALAGVAGITGVFLVDRRNRLKFITCGLIALALFIPELDIFREQLRSGDIGGWLGKPGIDFFWMFLLHVFNNIFWFTLLIFFLFIVSLLQLFQNKSRRNIFMVSFLFALTGGFLAWLYSIWVHPVVQYSTFFFGLPFLFLLLFSWSGWLNIRQPAFEILLSCFIAISLYSTIVSKQLFGKPQFGVFREVVNDLDAWYGAYGAFPCVINVINPDYIRYYFDQYHFHPEVYEWNVNSYRQVAGLNDRLKNCRDSLFCFAWSGSDHPWEIIHVVRNYYPVLLAKKAYFNSASYLFGATGKSIFPDTLWQQTVPTASISGPDAGIAVLDTGTDYSPGISKLISEIPGSGYRIVTVSTRFRSSVPKMTSSIVLSFDAEGQSSWFSSVHLEEFRINPDGWNEAVLSRNIPEEFVNTGKVNCYIYNVDGDRLEYDGIHVIVYNWDDPYNQ